MAAPGAGDLVDQRLLGVRVGRDVQHREVRRHEGVDQRREADAPAQTNVAIAAPSPAPGQRRVAPQPAGDRERDLREAERQRQHQRELAELVDHGMAAAGGLRRLGAARRATRLPSSAPRRPRAACTSRRAWRGSSAAATNTPASSNAPIATTPWPSRKRSGSSPRKVTGVVGALVGDHEVDLAVGLLDQAAGASPARRAGCRGRPARARRRPATACRRTRSSRASRRARRRRPAPAPGPRPRGSSAGGGRCAIWGGAPSPSFIAPPRPAMRAVAPRRPARRAPSGLAGVALARLGQRRALPVGLAQHAVGAHQPHPAVRIVRIGLQPRRQAVDHALDLRRADAGAAAPSGAPAIGNAPCAAT